MKSKAIAGLVLGILSIPSALLPLIGIPVGILGVVYSVKGMRQSEGVGIAGLVCSIIGLIFSVLNAAWGVYLAATGQFII